jgi:DNA-binding response OmpR family regulator
MQFRSSEQSSMAKILIVDDHVDTCEILRRLFQLAGWEAMCVTDSTRAPDAVRASHCDAVLLDVMMPDLDGFGVLSAIRSDPKTADTPVVMYSALRDQETLTRALEAGANDYIPKGTPFGQIRERLAAVAH